MSEIMTVQINGGLEKFRKIIEIEELTSQYGDKRLETHRSKNRLILKCGVLDKKGGNWHKSGRLRGRGV